MEANQAKLHRVELMKSSQAIGTSRVVATGRAGETAVREGGAHRNASLDRFSTQVALADIRSKAGASDGGAGRLDLRSLSPHATVVHSSALPGTGKVPRSSAHKSCGAGVSETGEGLTSQPVKVPREH